MSRKTDYERTSPEVIRLAEKIFSLALIINTETDFAVFSNFSGHINQFEVRLVKGKEDYDRDASDRFQTYLTPLGREPEHDSYEDDTERIISRLETVKTKLEKVLKKYSNENPYVNLEGDED